MGQVTPDSKNEGGQQGFSEGQAKLRVHLLVLPLRIRLASPHFPLGNHPDPQQPVHGLQAEFTLPRGALHEGEGPAGALQTPGHSLGLAMVMATNQRQ